jgi:hypothetical protein
LRVINRDLVLHGLVFRVLVLGWLVQADTNAPGTIYKVLLESGLSPQIVVFTPRPRFTLTIEKKMPIIVGLVR